MTTKKALLEKFGSEEAISAYYKEMGMRGKKTGTGGFYALKKNDPERLKEISKKALEKRYGKNS